MADEAREIDHLKNAKAFAEAGAQSLERGNMSQAERYFELSGVHAAIAQVEQTRRLADSLEAMGLNGIGVNGHVTTGSP